MGQRSMLVLVLEIGNAYPQMTKLELPNSVQFT